MKFKVKIEHDPNSTLGAYKGSLYEVDRKGEMELVTCAWDDDRDDLLRHLRDRRDAWLSRSEPVWVDLDDVPEPQSLRAV